MCVYTLTIGLTDSKALLRIVGLKLQELSPLGRGMLNANLLLHSLGAHGSSASLAACFEIQVVGRCEQLTH